jgi:hypothetical protein
MIIKFALQKSKSFVNNSHWNISIDNVINKEIWYESEFTIRNFLYHQWCSKMYFPFSCNGEIILLIERSHSYNINVLTLFSIQRSCKFTKQNMHLYFSLTIVRKRGMRNKCWLYVSLVIAKVGIVLEIHQKQITECKKGYGCK